MGITKEKANDSAARGFNEINKFVCTKCTGDKALRKAIRSNVVSKVCNYCNKQSRNKNIAAPVDQIIELILEGIVNIINTCNEQTGRTFRINKLDYTYELNLLGVMAFPPSPSYLSNFTYTIDNTIDQHRIVKIEEYFRVNKPIIEINNPVGFQAGYIEYVNPENRDRNNRIKNYLILN